MEFTWKFLVQVVWCFPCCQYPKSHRWAASNEECTQSYYHPADQKQHLYEGSIKLVIGKKNTAMHLVDLYLVKSSTNFCFLFVFVIHVQYTWYTCTGTVVVVHTLRAQQQFQECFLRTCTFTCGTLQSRAILHVRVLVFLS